ncbi:hypothetical protein E4631_23295 [Hymenobacter sp. UV11]|uniref:hypothetical protein n=1 Tax=Hymenobacter sp. UV11 TaxID=1849735 RepID=UPI001061EDBB|nr:hypothetical protein [Hymenobacter sp. UV11]TDN39845.1 hypothetical protein A8B98_16775 [Hymenobacter sp. UV11]TFZ63232.1 hypothetical protein E4631_23295 [Hymenobacter sp. UV11]
MNTANTTPNEPVSPEHNITTQELDRDLLNLNLPVIDLIATEEECEAMYPPGVYKRMMKEILGEDEAQKPTSAV